MREKKGKIWGLGVVGGSVGIEQDRGGEETWMPLCEILNMSLDIPPDP